MDDVVPFRTNFFKRLSVVDFPGLKEAVRLAEDFEKSGRSYNKKVVSGQPETGEDSSSSEDEEGHSQPRKGPSKSKNPTIRRMRRNVLTEDGDEENSISSSEEENKSE